MPLLGVTIMSSSVSRRRLLAGGALSGLATLLGTARLAQAQPQSQPQSPGARPAPPEGAGATAARLVANENPYGPSPRAREAVQAALASAWQYPMGEAMALRRELARFHDVPESHLMVGDGSGEILRISALMFTRERREVVAAVPTFGFLQDYARTLGATVREVPLDGEMRHDLEGLARAVGPGTGLIHVCNPNNPTGTLVPGDRIRPFVQTLSPKAPVLVDEAYLDLRDDAPAHSCIPRVLAGDPVIVTRTFSKLHGLAGLRIGYAIAPPELIAKLEAGRMSILNAAGLAAARASLADGEFQAFSRARIAEALAITGEALDAAGRSRTETRGNFVFFDTGRPPGEFTSAMRHAGFLVGRPFPPYTTWCRVSMGTVEQMRSFASALRAFYGVAAPG
jgi:histidinol-phosphate aminotransferase